MTWLQGKLITGHTFTAVMKEHIGCDQELARCTQLHLFVSKLHCLAVDQAGPMHAVQVLLPPAFQHLQVALC